ncbi:uncharacterized protein LOC135461432 [Liolophura sinensis]|uniref:uncharacterized protein LOC135461432 n=1 Tax=Liolophura sinensis TaxID=3198878 RepID=UPI0031590FE3
MAKNVRHEDCEKLSESVMSVCALPVCDFPSVVATKVLSLLTWRDKMNAVASIPPWEGHLHSAGAWPAVLYQTEAEANVYFVRDMRTCLLMCIKRYGRHMKFISINYAHQINRLGVKILLAIAENCKILQVLKISQKCPLTMQECGYTWSQSAVRAVCTIATVCSHLREISLGRPIIEWTMPPTSNVIIKLIQCDLQGLVTELELDSNSLMEHEGYLDILAGFVNLKKLTVRRDKINNDILLKTISNKLEELTLYQDEELHVQDSRQLEAEFWLKAVHIRPSLRVDLVLRFIVVIKDSFPAHMPLRCLVLDDLVNIVTKGVLDHIVESYAHTLEHFVYTNSYIETFETGDKRLPFALVDLVRKCEQLHSLQYGFPLSSTSLLLIAKARKLQSLLVPTVEVSYEFDWPVRPDWTDEFVDWLRNTGSSETKLERAVSELLGQDWKLCDTFAASWNQFDF